MILVTIALLFFAMLFILFPFISEVKTRRNQFAMKRELGELQNIELFKEQRALFLAQLESGELDEQQYQDLSLGAEKLLLANTKATTPLHYKNYSRGVWLLPCLLIILPIITLVTYYHLGAYQDEVIKSLIDRQSNVIPVNEVDNLAKNTKLIMALEKRVKQTPDNIYYWTILAQAAIGRNDFTAANDYFSSALKIDPQDSFLLGQYAESLFLVDQSRFTERVREAVDLAYSADPSGSTVLGLKGIEAYSTGEPAIAAEFWRKAQIELDPSSSIYKGLQVAIDQAESLVFSLGSHDLDRPLKKEGRQIILNVSIDPSISVEEDQLVFVAAIKAGGSSVPLAAKKISASRLPTAVILSDADALIPGQNLSSTEEIQVIARLSSTGLATPQAGDWEAVSGPFKIKKNLSEYPLIINSKRP